MKRRGKLWVLPHCNRRELSHCRFIASFSLQSQFFSLLTLYYGTHRVNNAVLRLFLKRANIFTLAAMSLKSLYVCENVTTG